MNLAIPRTRLSEGLKWVGRAVASRSQVPVMSCVMLEAADDKLTLTGSNGDVTHRLTLDATVHDDGVALIPAKVAADLVSALSGKDVELVTTDAGLTLSAGRSTYRLPLTPVEDYPRIPTFPAVAGTIDADDLSALVRNVKHAIDPGHPVTEIQGVRIVAGDGELRTVGTDNYVISTATAIWSSPADFAITAPVGQVDAAISGMTGGVEVGQGDGLLGFRDARSTVTLRVLTGKYAQWQKALRLEDEFSVEVDVAELVAAVKRASIALPDDKMPVWVSVAEDRIEIRTDRADDADGVEVIDATSTGTLVTGVKAGYLTSCLATLPTARASIGFMSDPRRPITVTADGDDSLTHLIAARIPNNR